MSRERKRTAREDAKHMLAHATMAELEAIIQQAGITIDTRGPYPVVYSPGSTDTWKKDVDEHGHERPVPTSKRGLRWIKANTYNDAVMVAASIALGLTDWP